MEEKLCRKHVESGADEHPCHVVAAASGLRRVCVAAPPSRGQQGDMTKRLRLAEKLLRPDV